VTEHPQAQRNPAWDPAVRRRVQRALDDVLWTARDVVTRYSDRDGCYAAPGPVADMGDVTGLLATGTNQVIRRLQAQLDEARQIIREVYAELDGYQRQQLGDAWKPLPRDV
jgi:hypothetical protein